VTETIPVVYIAGHGRSGSTLLDLLLGRLDGWFSMGEFRLMWHALRDDWRCGCSATVADCPVWSEVVARAQPGDVARVLADRRVSVRVRRVPTLGTRRLPSTPRVRDAHERFAQTLARTYAATKNVSAARVLVDSSKDPVYGLLLATVPGVQVHVVHLVRDSRAVAWSWTRSRGRPEIAASPTDMPVHSPLHTSLEWDMRNALAHVLGRKAASYTRMTYESLVRAPDAAVDAIARTVTGAGAVCAPGGVNHTVAGNPMRFDGAAITVKPDDEWRDALGRRDRRLVTTLTWPLLRAYGYGGAERS
jgi:hypothetical protein